MLSGGTFRDFEGPRGSTSVDPIVELVGRCIVLSSRLVISPAGLIFSDGNTGDASEFS